MLDENTKFYNVAMLLSRNKNISYKNSITKTSTSLLRFLHDNDLLVDLVPFDENGILKHDTIIRKKNLTQEGCELFMRRIVDGWHGYLGRSTAPNKYENVSRLEKGLKKIREERAHDY